MEADWINAALTQHNPDVIFNLAVHVLEYRPSPWAMSAVKLNIHLGSDRLGFAKLPYQRVQF
jgi:hypothetical protein